MWPFNKKTKNENVVECKPRIEKKTKSVAMVLTFTNNRTGEKIIYKSKNDFGLFTSWDDGLFSVLQYCSFDERLKTPIALLHDYSLIDIERETKTFEIKVNE